MTVRAERKPVILMVDDNPVNLAELYALLGEAGYEVLVAESGASALLQAERSVPDLILLDVVMPGMNGFAVCARLKESPRTEAIPVLFTTSLDDTADKIQGLRLGAVDYITKPFQHEEVLARVNTHLTLARLRGELESSRERLSRIVTYALDAIVTTDEERRIVLFNAAAEAMFACRSADVLGGSLDRFLSPTLKQRLLDYIGGSSEPAFWLPDGLEVLRGDGLPVPVEGSVSRVESGGERLYTVILRNAEERQKRLKAEAECRQLQGVNLYLEEELKAVHNPDDLIGSSPALRRAVALVGQVAGTDSAVLVTGETGTGKELIARAIHNRSARKDKVLVKLNCASIPANLAESELFGHEKGAFTGALQRKQGRFEIANGGTLFLDEVGELPLDLQAKLLRVLQEGEFERVGGTQTIKVNVRVVAATNRDLAQMAREGSFRPDLYYRLNVFPIHLPPLRERAEDIPSLVRHFVAKYANQFGKRIDSVPEATLARVGRYGWPGNIRELQHVIERAVILSSGSELAPLDLAEQAGPDPLPGPLAALEDVERQHILKVLEHTRWRISGEKGAAVILGMPSTTLRSRMERLGITRGR
ncbi:sigma-54-dependent Fis family transcriptional regulator [Methylococcus sp. EFPC2]|uniref:sigma-54-dependent Fis family transcriptional regulator n=1 Tax=Methylococcus sp. EFPC2 TaxID=2812648 RepID=UPI00196760F9|nr:sigma-54-dependent Fis family transcriptional regulator [Methylococcus sp. EFPC2]QSA97919.1 sigma-54-dependent Fis family transcriptional regulator [Methylococcus sp. EFPC2]